MLRQTDRQDNPQTYRPATGGKPERRSGRLAALKVAKLRRIVEAEEKLAQAAKVRFKGAKKTWKLAHKKAKRSAKKLKQAEKKLARLGQLKLSAADVGDSLHVRETARSTPSCSTARQSC